MKKAFRHHYVPQYYLRRFAFDPEKSKVYAYDISTDSDFATSTRNVAHEKGFNDIDTPPDIPSLETVTAIFDGGHSHATEHLAATRVGYRMTTEDVNIMTHVMLFQYTRTKAALAQQVEFTNEFSDLISGSERGYRFSHVAHKKAMSAFFLRIVENEDLRGGVVRRFWRGYVNTTHTPFITSDAPSIIFPNHPEGHIGINAAPNCIILPVSPTFVITCCHEDRLSGLPNGICISASYKEIRFLNAIQVFHAWRQVYSTRSDCGNARKLCTRHPEFREPGGTRHEGRRSGKLTYMTTRLKPFPRELLW